MRRKRRVGVARTVADDDAARKGWGIDVERGEGPRRGVRARGERRRRGEPRRARGDEANARVVVDAAGAAIRGGDGGTDEGGGAEDADERGDERGERVQSDRTRRRGRAGGAREIV